MTTKPEETTRIPEQELEALYDALCEEMTENQIIDAILSMGPEAPDMTPESEAELDRLTDQLVSDLNRERTGNATL